LNSALDQSNGEPVGDFAMLERWGGAPLGAGRPA
jgi:hypothetical protein